MLDQKGFDLWADSYDESVRRSSDSESYPFAGYQNVLQRIYQTICKSEYGRILDIGFGTAALTKRLYDNGFYIYGLDFSREMTAAAKQKMPGATLVLHDMRRGIPECFDGIRFSHIVLTYSIHHLTDREKVWFIKDMRQSLRQGGSILIGDVAFKTRTALEQCRSTAKEDWDDSEHYIVYDELSASLRHFETHFAALSLCAGVMTVK